MDPEVHFRGFVLDASVGMSGGIIEELVDAEDDVFPRAGGDGGSNGADGGLHGVVNGASIVVEDAGEFLTVFDLSGSEFTSGASWFGILLFLAVYGGGIRVRRVLRLLGWWMTKSCKGFGDILGHGEVDGAVLVIPIQMDATEDFAIAVDCYIVVFLETVDEVVGMDLANDFDAEVIDDEIESGGTRDVTEEPWSMAGRDVTIVGEMLDEFDVGEPSSLGKAVHASADLSEELLVFDQGAKVVFLHDVFWDGPFGNVEVFVLAGVVERCDQVEVGKIKAEKGGTWSGDDTVEEEFGGGEISSCLLYTSPSPRDLSTSRMPSSA